MIERTTVALLAHFYPTLQCVPVGWSVFGLVDSFPCLSVQSDSCVRREGEDIANICAAVQQRYV
jgi:hypothetical protein